MDPILSVFLIAVLGFLIGSIQIAGIKLGDSAILLVALVFGHFGFLVSDDLKNFGLMFFVCAVGYIAGPVFFENFKQRAFAYIALGAVIIVAGAACTAGAILLLGIPTPLSLGLFTGAMTSTPGLAVASEVTGDATSTVGYGIAYPFGVIGVVLFCQLIPKLLHADIPTEAGKLRGKQTSSQSSGNTYKKVDGSGFFPFCLAMVAGLLLAWIEIPLPGGLSFSLGTSGGPLISGLLFGKLGHIGSCSLEVPEKTLNLFRELGLILFLMGAGTSAGQGFVDVLNEYGWNLFAVGAVITLVPMIIGYILSVRLFRLEMFNSLGAICGGMTSTPALGTLIDVAGTNNVAAAYAATYPIALIVIVFSVQIISILLP